jgi:hypothetical protein
MNPVKRLTLLSVFVSLAIALCAAASDAQTSDRAAASAVVRADVLTKSVFVEDLGVGTVTDIIHRPTKDAEWGVAGLAGAVFLKADRTVQSRVKFARAVRTGIMALFATPLVPTRVQFVETSGHREWEFLNRGGVGWQDGCLFGKEGRLRWVYGGSPGLDDLAAGDLDGDGRADFVAGFNGGGGVRRLDSNGKEIWKKPGANIWHVEIVDTDGDGKPEIVHTSAKGDFTVRDSNGATIRIFQGADYCSDFTLCRWPSQKSAPKILFFDDKKLVLVDLMGVPCGRYPFPRPERLLHICGQTFRAKKGEQEHLAILATSDKVVFATSNLFVFDANRQITFQSPLPGRCASIFAIPDGSSGIDVLLVGGTNTIWQFRTTSNEASKSPIRQ